jgi:hypothetical protein
MLVAADLGDAHIQLFGEALLRPTTLFTQGPQAFSEGGADDVHVALLYHRFL